MTAKEQEVGGIIVTADMNEEKTKHATGEVIALGSGKVVNDLGINVGDTIIFSKYVGEIIEQNEVGAVYSGNHSKEEVRILAHHEVLAVK